MTYPTITHAIDFERYPILPVLWKKILFLAYKTLCNASMDLKWKSNKFSGNCMVFDRMISSNKQQLTAFLNAATFLVRCVLFYTFLLNCDSTSTTQVWARLKHFFSLLQYNTKLNASIAARNIKFCKCGRVIDVYHVQTSNTVDNLNLWIAFCLVSWLNDTYELKRN